MLSYVYIDYGFYANLCFHEQIISNQLEDSFHFFETRLIEFF